MLQSWTKIFQNNEIERNWKELENFDICISSAMRQKGESQNECYEKIKGVRNVHFSENLAGFVYLLPPFVTSIRPFTLLPTIWVLFHCYCRSIFSGRETGQKTMSPRLCLYVFFKIWHFTNSFPSTLKKIFINFLIFKQ